MPIWTTGPRPIVQVGTGEAATEVSATLGDDGPPPHRSGDRGAVDGVGEVPVEGQVAAVSSEGVRAGCQGVQERCGAACAAASIPT